MEAATLRRHAAATVPRYTSYPTAPHFHAGVGAAAYRRWLSGIGDGDAVSLYFHVPFCERLCWYCGCHTRATRRSKPLGDYARLLRRELGLVAEAMGGRPSVVRVHFGGGTPTLLANDDLKAVMDAARDLFPLAPAAEVAVEVDPCSLTRDKARALAHVGVTRASLGVQTLSAAVQAAVNRIQPFAVTADAVRWLRDSGIADLNVDLMYGLPRQTAADVRATVDRVAELGPDRFAVFGYAHVPWLKRHQRLIDERELPGVDERLEQARAAGERLARAGYRAVGLDHFALPGDRLLRALEEGRLKRNFQGYTDDPADALIGFGASAIGSLPQGYAQNAVADKDYAEAVGRGELATARGIALAADDRLRRAVIERLMCDFAVELEAVAVRHGVSAAAFADELAALGRLADEGLVTVAGARIAVTDAGRPLVRTIAAVFDRYLARGRASHSRAA
jgi:oxygen-independent coproporphyrinogen-3 oxidase